MEEKKDEEIQADAGGSWFLNLVKKVLRSKGLRLISVKEDVYHFKEFQSCFRGVVIWLTTIPFKLPLDDLSEI